MSDYYTVDDTVHDNLDGCDLDFNDASKNTRDDEIDALVMFADVDWTDPDAVEARRVELVELEAITDAP